MHASYKIEPNVVVTQRLNVVPSASVSAVPRAAQAETATGLTIAPEKNAKTVKTRSVTEASLRVTSIL